MVRFFSAHNRMHVADVHQGRSNIIADFQRMASLDKCVTINGTPLSKMRAKYDNFDTEEAVKSFFNQEILKYLPDKSGKQQAIEYLMLTMHQGGLLNPVSAAMHDAVKQTWPSGQVTINNTERLQSINIVSTKDGFKVQEIATFKKLDIRLHKKVKATDPEADQTLNKYILSSAEFQQKSEEFGQRAAINDSYILAGEPHAIKAHATLDVNLSEFLDSKKSKPQPQLTVDENAISYGHPHIKEKMDNRSLGQIIVDFFKHIFGMNAVKDISVGAQKPIVMDPIGEGAADDNRPSF